MRTHNLVFAAVMCLAIGVWTIASFRGDAVAQTALSAQQAMTIHVNELPVQTFDAI